jgi:hypothetical protein
MSRSSRSIAAASLLIFSVPVFSQTKRGGAALPAAPTPNGGVAASATATPPNHPELKAYLSCGFPDGLQVSGTDQMPSDVRSRPVQVHGETKSVPLLDGWRITFGYPGEQPYASVKLELLPATNYLESKRLLLADFDDIVASDKNVTRATRTAPMSGFSVVGLDRNSLSGTTLGIYMLMDDRAHTVMTAYFLNPGGKKFKTPQEYGQMRDTFLYNYTHCVRSNQNSTMFGGAK